VIRWHVSVCVCGCSIIECNEWVGRQLIARLAFGCFVLFLSCLHLFRYSYPFNEVRSKYSILALAHISSTKYIIFMYYIVKVEYMFCKRLLFSDKNKNFTFWSLRKQLKNNWSRCLKFVFKNLSFQHIHSKGLFFSVYWRSLFVESAELWNMFILCDVLLL
jgi:hypothetical protein